MQPLSFHILYNDCCYTKHSIFFPHLQLSCTVTDMHAHTFCALLMLDSASSQALWRKTQLFQNSQVFVTSNKRGGSLCCRSSKLKSVVRITHFLIIEQKSLSISRIQTVLIKQQNTDAVLRIVSESRVWPRCSFLTLRASNRSGWSSSTGKDESTGLHIRSEREKEVLT